MVTFQIASDLHIEHKNDEHIDPLILIEPSADILILAGDIGSLYKRDQLFDFLKKISEYFKIVIYVPGNTEYYKVRGAKTKTMPELNRILSDIEGQIHNLYILSGKSLLIGDICIAGCTLWSDIKVPIPKYMVRIHGMTSDIYKKMYDYDLRYIEDIIQHCKKMKYRLVMVTHYCPTYDVLKETKKQPALYSLYASCLDNMLREENITMWVCGHIHKNFKYKTKGGTLFVGNQKGKPKDNILDYDRSLIFSI